jgi:hypothetical protein
VGDKTNLISLDVKDQLNISNKESLTDDDYQECSRLSSTSGMSELQEVTDIKGLSPLYIY